MEATRQTAGNHAGGPGIISLRGVSKRFGAVAALDGVNLDIAAGEVHALLGENGAGKTTLLSLLSGLHRPDGGMILVDGNVVTLTSPADALRLGIGTVHQHLTLVPTLTVRENLLLGDEGGFVLGWKGRRDGETERRKDGENDEVGLDLPMGARVGELAIGVRQRVEIAKALRRGRRALLLDEPTAVLGAREVDALLKLARELAAAGRAVVLVTHKLDEALAVSDRITVLKAGRVVLSEVVGGDWEGVRRRVVAAMFGGGERGASDSRTVGESERGDVGARFIAPVPGGGRRDESRGHGGGGGWAEAGWSVGVGAMNRVPTALARRPILVVDWVSARDDRGAVALHGLSLGLLAGEILGVAGVEGNGQRELAEVVAGQRRVTGGKIRLDGEDVTALGVAGRLAAGISMLTDERFGEGVVPGASVALNLALKRLPGAPFSAGIRLNRRAIRRRAVELIAEHDIRPANPERDIATLSGGNIQKALVARELSGNPRVLVAVKPTAGLDVRTAERVLERLRDHVAGGAAVLMISNELDELLAIADRIAVVYRGQVVGLVERAAFDREAIGAAMVTGQSMLTGNVGREDEGGRASSEGYGRSDEGWAR